MNDVNVYPKVLVVSHNCFSTSGSNGRTLGNFFVNWPKEALAQFFIFNEIPDSPVCENYFRVTDTEALKAFYKGSQVGRTVKNEVLCDHDEDSDLLLNKVYKRHRRKTSFNYIVRNLIWDSKKWINRRFIDWVNEFSPDVILLQIGDFSFMIKIAMSIAKERNIPVILYNSEDYYFKNKKSISPLYHYYRSQYMRQFENLMNYASHTIYICDKLQDTYNKQFNHESTVLMTATNMVPLQINKKDNDPPVISYLGNLGIGRHESLIEIANTLQEINPNLYLKVYGKIPNEPVNSAFDTCTGIQYKGLVSYEEVVQIMQESDLLVHAENFSEFSKRDLKHAFSTKIADCLASGTCFFVYAPENIACTEYLKGNNGALVVTDKIDLKGSLIRLINDKELRQRYVATAQEIVSKRHNAKDNAEYIKRIVNDIVKKVSG